ncbi:MAG: branched-chain amino acid transport system II carrier protein [Oscillospiraceae bacterium]|nr:branched-chain amino acid transport system II carrier protein [Oscillospiraceae bacterium]
MQQKVTFGRIMILGFALFAMFFGAGNLILPPALGKICGGNWFFGFLMYIVVDAGLAVMALLAFVRAKGDIMAETSRQLTPAVGFLLTFLNTLCLGPLIAIPRTASTTFEIAIKPLLTKQQEASAMVNGVPAEVMAEGPAPWVSWVFGAVYFGIVLFLCIKPGKVVDIIGKILSPVMLVALLILIAIGVLHPLGEVGAPAPLSESLSAGLLAGYQTMDMLGALLLGVVALLSVRESGITEERDQIKMIACGGVIASVGLFIVYCGLSYLGATATDAKFNGLVENRTQLLIEITHDLVGSYGQILLGLIVAAACLTTAIGLVSSCAKNFEEITGDKLPYKPTLFAVIFFSFMLSNLGTEMILSIAAPILNVIFPIYIMLVFLSFLPERIRMNTYAAPLGAGFAMIVSVLTELDSRFPSMDLYTLRLPLAQFGLGWLVPSVAAAVIGGVIGRFIPRGVERAENAEKK